MMEAIRRLMAGNGSIPLLPRPCTGTPTAPALRQALQQRAVLEHTSDANSNVLFTL